MCSSKYYFKISITVCGCVGERNVVAFRSFFLRGTILFLVLMTTSLCSWSGAVLQFSRKIPAIFWLFNLRSNGQIEQDIFIVFFFVRGVISRYRLNSCYINLQFKKTKLEQGCVYVFNQMITSKSSSTSLSFWVTDLSSSPRSNSDSRSSYSTFSSSSVNRLNDLIDGFQMQSH